ncbi:hypothetical protein ACVGX7_00375, partial [Enterobacter hormaechei]
LRRAIFINVTHVLSLLAIQQGQKLIKKLKNKIYIYIIKILIIIKKLKILYIFFIIIIKKNFKFILFIIKK